MTKKKKKVQRYPIGSTRMENALKLFEAIGYEDVSKLVFMEQTSVYSKSIYTTTVK